MKYDLFNQDPKNIICVNCEDMTIYSAPPRIDFERKVFWIENNQSMNLGGASGDHGKFTAEQAAEYHRRAKKAEQINVN